MKLGKKMTFNKRIKKAAKKTKPYFDKIAKIDEKLKKAEIDEKNAISHAGEPMKESNMVYAKSTFHYIGSWHRLFLWMFPVRKLVAEEESLMTKCTLYVKYVFGHIFIVGESWKSYVNDEEIKEYEELK